MIAPGEWQCSENPKKLPVPKDAAARRWLEERKKQDPFWYLPDDPEERLWLKL